MMTSRVIEQDGHAAGPADWLVRSAYHEAGHVIGARSAGLHCARVLLRPDVGGAVTITTAGADVCLAAAVQIDDAPYGPARRRDYARTPLIPLLVYLLAGVAAESRWLGHRPPDAGWYDRWDVETILSDVTGAAPYGARVQGLLAILERHAQRQVARHWPAIVRVATALLARGTLGGAELRLILSDSQERTSCGIG
jgi:hypothetical protein